MTTKRLIVICLLLLTACSPPAPTSDVVKQLRPETTAMPAHCDDNGVVLALCTLTFWNGTPTPIR